MATLGIQLNQIMNHPMVYDAFQGLIGAPRMRGIVVSEFVRPKPGDRILDIGCGTAGILEHLKRTDVTYHGIDSSADCVAFAAKKWGEHKAFNFFHAAVGDEMSVIRPGEYDVTMVLGVLHHLTDREVIMLLELAHRALKNGGRLILVEPSRFDKMNRLESFLIDHDRGEYIRDVQGYDSLVARIFPRRRSAVRGNMSYLPARGVVFECTKGTQI